MSDRDIALAAARRIALRRTELHPRHPFSAVGFARNGSEIPHPYCGGPPETWSPPPGAEYTRAEVREERDGTVCETVYVLRQKEASAKTHR